MVKRPVMFIIFLYKKIISPLLPPSCRFYPSCSDYAYHAIEEHGPAKGVLLAAKRLFKCHPLNPGGFDPVPETGNRTGPISDSLKNAIH
jgi:putative membrane protein insertion efficiency factor